MKRKAKKKHCWTCNCQKDRSHESTLNMLNSSVVLVDQIMITDARKAIAFRYKIEEPRVQKN